MMKEIYQIDKDQTEFDNIFDERNIYISLAIQFKASNPYSLFHTEILISWTFLGFIEPYKTS